MRIVMYGNPLGLGGAMTEIPFLLDGRIERIYADAVDLQDLEADIAIANFTRDPLNSGNETGWNYLRLPKVKVQLAIQAEHFSEYIPEWTDGITHNFDGSICYDFNRPFFDFDESIHPCFARSYWDEHNFTVKPRFYFDPLVKWNNFYPGTVKSMADYGYIIGSDTVHRLRLLRNNPSQYRFLVGDMRDPRLLQELRNSGIGINAHKFQLRGKCPETDKIEVKNVAKTEAIRLSMYYNLGMAVVSEKLDHTFPDRLKNCIIETELENYVIDKEVLLNQVLETEKVFNEHHDLNTELDNLINNIVKEYNL